MQQIQHLAINCTEPHSTNDFNKSPDLVRVIVSYDFLRKARQCVEFVERCGARQMSLPYTFAYTLYEDADYLEDSELEGKPLFECEGEQYVEFEPDYALDGCHAKIDADGEILAVMPMKHVDGKLWCSLGYLKDLLPLAGMNDEQPLRYWAVTGRIPGDDEDTLHTFHVATRDEAMRAFEEAMWADEPDPETGRENVRKEHDTTVFINSIVVSDTQIEEA